MRSSVLAWSLVCLVGCGAPGGIDGGPSSPSARAQQADEPKARALAKYEQNAGSPGAKARQGKHRSDEAAADAEDLEEGEDHEHAEYGEEDGGYTETELGLGTARATSLAARSEPARSLDGLSRADLLRILEEDAPSLGPLSVGLPNSGRLFNAVALPESKLFHRVSPDFAWGTQETVDFLELAVRRVHEQFADTPPLLVGHLSSKSGGHLSPHLSHQSGRDVDLAFYYVDKPRWYARATAQNLDLPRTWALVRALIAETDVEMILIDQAVIEMLRDYALAQGEDPVWLERAFSHRNGGRGIVRHVRGHRTHLHVRFFNPDAQRRAQSLYPLLVEKKLVPPVTVYSTFRAKKGDTLGKIAKRQGCTVDDLKRANGLKKSLIVAGRVYKIPRTGGPRPIEQALTFPPRLVPPSPRPPKAPATAGVFPRADAKKSPRAVTPPATSARASKSQ